MGLMETTIEVNTSPKDSFEIWTCVNCIPAILNPVVSAYTQDKQTYWHWQIETKDRLIEWDTVIDSLDPNASITWHSVDGAVVDASGHVGFEALTGSRTRIHIEMMFNPPANAGEFVYEIFSKDIGSSLFDDLQFLAQQFDKPGVHQVHALQPVQSVTQSNSESNG